MDVHLPFSVRARHDRLVSVEVRICTEMSASRQNCSSEGLAEWIVPCAFVGTNPENEAQPKVNECIALITPVEVHGETSSSPHQLHGQPDRKARRPGSATLMCEYPSDAIS